MAMPEKIEHLYAWVCTDPEGNEGVAGHVVPGLSGITPLIGADKERIEGLRPYAQAVMDETGYPTVLKLFSGGQVLDTLRRRR